MRWLLTEYVFKGLFVGLVLLVALQEPGWSQLGEAVLCTLAGLVLFLAIAGGRKLRQGYRIRGRFLSFLLFLLLESPVLVYTGILLGLAAGTYWVGVPGREDLLAPTLGGGLVLGFLLWLLRNVRRQVFRLVLCLFLAGALVAGALFWLDKHPELLAQADLRNVLGVWLLVGLPLFYLLTFAGLAEETEVEIGVMCAGLGLALWLLLANRLPTPNLIFLVPLVLYYFYTSRVLPGLRIFKHVVRGIGFANVGRYRPALEAYRRALQLDPTNKLARESLWALHKSMDWQQVAQAPEVLRLVDFDLCLERATALLLQPGPGEEKLAEARHLLDLVQNYQPAKRPIVHYWRAVAGTHARQYDQAAAELEQVLDGKGYAPEDPYRASVLFPAWQLALTLHPEMNRRVGTKQLELPGRRMEAIAAVERRLADTPDDAGAWDLKRLLYASLKEGEYESAAGEKEGGGRRAASGGSPASGNLPEKQESLLPPPATRYPPPSFDHAYAQQLGLALLNDPNRWQRGVEYLRIAAGGLPASAPGIFLQIAQAYQKAGRDEEVWRYDRQARQAGLAAGIKNLSDEERQAFFTAVKALADHAQATGDLGQAIENYRLLTEAPRSGVETLRTLAGLYEQKGDVLNALRTTEQALLYNARDRDLLEKKDRYYFSLMPADLKEHLEALRNFFDTDYCLRKARSLLDYKDVEPDVIDWAEHLARLALVVAPDSLAAKMVLVRALRRRGETEQAKALLEDIYAHKAEVFASSADEEAWYLSCRLLGEMYLYELGRPDLAVTCFTEYRKSPKSGADTMYKLAQAYEQLGDRPRAAKYYELVTAYEGHPL
ncbi:MAG: tetratricopeptide repeat protein, partial [Planctomycetes bacterium]|nr:tetratricopeptide repeat protein [Planctomycetota bacterium]